jgi:hypothetical protein
MWMITEMQLKKTKKKQKWMNKNDESKERSCYNENEKIIRENNNKTTKYK